MMETFEFSLVFRHTSRTDKNLKVRFQGNESRRIGDQAQAWFGQHLRAKVEHQWQLPSSGAILAGMEASAGNPDGSGIISNTIDGIIAKVRRVVKPSAARKAAAKGPPTT